MDFFQSKLKNWTKDLTKALDQTKSGASKKTHPVSHNGQTLQNNPTFCSPCAGITWDKLRRSYAHHPDFWALKESAKACPLCKVLLQSLQTEDELPAVNEQDLKGTDSQISLEGTRLTGEAGWEDQLYLKCGSRIKIIDVHVENGNLGTTRGRIQDRADSEANFNWLRKQLQDCLTSHAGCALGGQHPQSTGDAPQRLPTRVVDVGNVDGSDAVKLIETGRKPGKYVALSHCWGKVQIITTTKDTTDKSGVFVEGTLQQHYNEIPWDKLSKTFREAVTVCRKLDMRYLWIDSLCIIQNDAKDWAAESAYMGDIYRTASFSIMAAGADGGAAGCFVNRSGPALQPIRVEYLNTHGSHEALSIGLPKGSLHAGLEDGPLQSRSWCLQERVLSRRSIHFCKEHIVWECQMDTVGEDSTKLDRMEVYQIKLHDKMGTSSHLRHQLQGRWRRIVQDYTNRDITKGSDKLPAISGLAQIVQTESADQYAAGLWKGHLHNDLFWFAVDHTEPVVPYRAPTWSWAAYDGPISYNEVFDMNTIYFDPTLEDVEIFTTPTTVNSFGEIDSGHIACRGRMMKALYSADPTGKDFAVTQHSRKIYSMHTEPAQDRHGGTEALGYGAMDAECKADMVVECLSIAVKHQQPGPWHAVLLTKPTGIAGEYRRIGAALINPLGWFDEVEYRCMKLI